MADKSTVGTAEPTAFVTRDELERALRFLNMSDLDLRELVLSLAAQVVTLTDELTRRLDHVEPLPAEPNTPAPAPTTTIEAAVADHTPTTLEHIRAATFKETPRVWLESELDDKYPVNGPDIPCTELMHLCKARCCTLTFPLSSQDLDEGIIRWDYGQPYMIRQRASDGYCVHNAPDTHGCTVHANRPLTCRRYDCRDDKRIWADFENRVVAAPGSENPASPPFDLMDRATKYTQAMQMERDALRVPRKP